jgi:hypothetical protein
MCIAGAWNLQFALCKDSVSSPRLSTKLGCSDPNWTSSNTHCRQQCGHDSLFLHPSGAEGFVIQL